MPRVVFFHVVGAYGAHQSWTLFLGLLGVGQSSALLWGRSRCSLGP